MSFSLNIENTVSILAGFMVLSIILYYMVTLIYYLKVVKKLDKVILSHGIDKDQFDLFYRRFNYYKKAVFNPSFFTEKKKVYIFDPKILEGRTTNSDRQIMKLHTFFYRVALIFVALLVIFSSFT